MGSHNDFESCMQHLTIIEGSQLGSVDINVVGTSDISLVDDSCCSEFGISYQIRGDDSKYLLDDDKS